MYPFSNNIGYRLLAYDIVLWIQLVVYYSLILLADRQDKFLFHKEITVLYSRLSFWDDNTTYLKSHFVVEVTSTMSTFLMQRIFMFQAL